MSWDRPRGRRTTALLALSAATCVLAGCGTATDEQSPTTTIPGSTVTIGTEPFTPTDSASPDPSTDPSEPSDPSETAPATLATAQELFEQVGGAMGEFDSVRVSASANGVSQEADYAYGAGGDYVVRIDGAGSLVQEYRKVGDTLYYLPQGSQDWQVYDPEQAPADLDGLLSEALAYDLLADLTRELTKAQDFAADPDAPDEVGGTPVETYTFDLEPRYLAADPDSVDMLPEGDVRVSFAVDTTGLPVQISYVFANGSGLTSTFSGWGDEVDVEVPQVG